MPQFSFDLEDINGNNGFIVEDASAVLSLSTSSSVIDYNDDGIDDLVVTSLADGGLIQDLHIIYGGEELPANLDLNNLDGDNGVTISNISGDPLVNFNISTSGVDFNSDGAGDLQTTNIEQLGTGEFGFTTRIVFGDSDLPTTIDLNNLDGDNGTQLGGELLVILAQPININGDGADDLFVSAADLAVSDSDETLSSFIIFGRDGNVPATINPSLLNGRNASAIDLEGLPVILGEREDINNDGIEDLAINLFSLEGDSGSSNILFGSETFDATIDAETFDGDSGFKIIGGSTQNRLTNATLIGDTNGDEISDIFVNRSTIDVAENDLELDPLAEVEDSIEFSSQRAFIVYGGETFDEDFSLTDIDGNNGFEIINSDSNSAILNNTATLDLNNDELLDFYITDDESGQSFVVFGQSTEVEEIDLSDLAASEGFALAENDFEITGVDSGDFNGDGIDDLILETSETGEEIDYVVFGSEDSFGRELDFVDEDANALEIVVQTVDLEITDIIDLNDDGADDLVYGAAASPETLFVETESTVFPDVQVVFGDVDLGAS